MFKWLKHNLFSSLKSSLVSIVILWVAGKIIISLSSWAILNANLSGTSPQACINTGACWVFIKARFNQFMYGFYPLTEQWRINSIYFIVTITLLALAVPKQYRAKKYVLWFTLLLPGIAYFFLYGGFNLQIIPTHLWSGLFLTLVVSTIGITLSLPIGIMVALGRRSHMLAIKYICIIFIEIWRGVPLISILFMASVMFPLLLPSGIEVAKLLRALAGITLFSSAYMAEVIRGGLQSIPGTQYEASKALGLRYWPTMFYIILPQALKNVIPGIVNTFIGLFKDTTLLLIIGIFDLLGMIQAANTDPKWLAYNIEGYVFAAFVYWLFCFGMSRYSIHLEHKSKVANYGITRN